MSQARHQSRAGPGEEGLSDTLCQDCEGLCESGFRPFPFLLKDDYQGFLRSARRCSLCNLMVVSLRRAYDQFDHDHNRLSGFSEQHVGYNDDGATDTRSAKRKRATFQLSALGIPPNHVDVMAGMMYKKERILTKSRILVFSPPDPDPRLDADAKYRLVRRWLAEENVLLPTSGIKGNSVTPKRIISLGRPSSLTTTLRLVETCSLSSRELADLEYVTLSHRWGTSRHFVTQKSTLNNHLAGFQMESLPLTYQDAVAIARKLGYQYLWIDAVCIIQDDDEDWEQEAVRMGGIYNSAAFTIAAHSSANDTDGFLSKAMRRTPATRIPYDSARKTGKEWEIYGSQCPNFDADVSGSPLCRRAWVLQERLLSPRILHFTDGFIYWESLQHTKAEDGEDLTAHVGNSGSRIDQKNLALNPRINEFSGSSKKNIANLMDVLELQNDEVPKHEPADVAGPTDSTTPWSWNGKARFCLSDMPELSQVLYQSIRGPQSSSVFDRMIVPFDYSRSQEASDEGFGAQQSSPSDWFKVVEFYSTTSITHSKDKLIAISGLARHIHRRIGVPYYCGLWADQFLIQLLWFRGDCHFHWSVEPRAPSWSWAAVDGEILYPLSIQKVSVEPNIRILGLAAEPMIRGAEISRSSWLGGLGSPILHVKMRKVSSPGYWISGDEDLGSGPRKTRQTSFEILKFQRNVLSMRLRYQSRTVGLVVWDDATFNGDKSLTELQTMAPEMFCVRIAHLRTNANNQDTVDVDTSSSTAIRRKPLPAAPKPPGKSRPRHDSDSDQGGAEKPRLTVQPRWKSQLPLPEPTSKSRSPTTTNLQVTRVARRRRPPPVSGKPVLNEDSTPVSILRSQSDKIHDRDRDGPVFLVLFLIPVDGSETTFRRVACGQISPEFAWQSHMWESKTIAII